MGHRSRLVGAVACAALLTAAGCSGGDDGGGGTAKTSITAPPSTTPLTDGVLTIGTLLPQSGSQAALGPPMVAAAALAVRDINQAGGVNGKPVELVKADSGDASTNTATTSLDALLGAKVDAIVGPASAGVAGLVVDRITTARLLFVTPANPLAEAPAGSRSFHTAPGEELRARAAADQLVAAKATKVAIVARKDPYGDRLANATKEALGAAGVANVVITYSPDDEVFDTTVAKITDAEPDALVLAGYAEIADIVTGLAGEGLGPAKARTVLLTDRIDTVGSHAKPGVMTGAAGLVAEVAPDAKLLERLRSVDPTVTSTTYAAETYDAVAIVAIAALAARTDFSASVAAAIAPTTSGGETCTTIAACRDALNAGKQISYRGYGGAYHFDDKGAPTTGSFAWETLGADNKPDPAKTTYVQARAS